jgi:23S rRNA (cytidine1920-2'-O)/16S rRNA (cytidine1409-2'-O)-methyltransferase
MERTNVMRLRTADLDPPADRAVADLSFRSLRGAAAHILGLAREGCGIFLVKPQFEWEDPPEEFDGIVRQGSAVREILRSLAGDLQEESVTVVAAMPSPFRGRKGNREFLFLLRRGTRGRPDRLPEILESLVLE